MRLTSSSSLIASALFVSSSLAAPSIGVHGKPNHHHHHHVKRDAAAIVEIRNVMNDDPWAALDDAARAVVRNTAGKSPTSGFVKDTG